MTRFCSAFRSIALTGLVRLHSDPIALWVPPFPHLVLGVPLEFLHADFAMIACHGCLLVAWGSLGNSPRTLNGRQHQKLHLLLAEQSAQEQAVL